MEPQRPQGYEIMIDETEQKLISSLLQTILRDAHLDLTFQCRRNRLGISPCLYVEFFGPDVPALLYHHGELLLAFEHIATQALRLSPEQHDEVSFDARGFKAARDRNLRRAASEAMAQVQTSGQPFHFAPMSSRERRLLHLVLAPSGLQTVSEGEPPRRHLVLSPKPECATCGDGAPETAQ